MKLKKKWIIVVPIIIAFILFIGLYFFINRVDENSFTSSDQKWIKENVAKVMDFEVISNYPVFGENKGVFYQFIDSFKEATGFDFNVIPYLKEGKASTNSFRFQALDNSVKLTEKDLLLQEDPYVLVGKTKKVIQNISELKDLQVGVLSRESSEISDYLKGAGNVSYKLFSTVDKMFEALDEKNIDLLVIPNLMYLNKTIKKDTYYIQYVLSEMKKNIVLTLSEDNKRMNEIVLKYYTNWKNNKYVTIYNEKLLDYYVSFNDINDKDKTDFLTKSYVYGYVDNFPYESVEKGKIHGIAGEYMNRMIRLANTEFLTFKKYDTIADLKKAIDKKEVDIYFNYFDYETNDYQRTLSPFVEKFVVLSKVENGNVVPSFESLKDVKVTLLKDNAVYDYFRDNSKAILNEVSTLDDLTNSDNKVLVVDKEVYSYYKSSKFADYDVLYEDSITNEYNFMVKNDEANDTFYQLFDYIMMTNSYYRYRNSGLNSLNLSILERSSFEELYVILLLIVFVPLGILAIIYLILKKRKEVKVVKKEERRKYTDLLTSLKNRNYLNFNMKLWNDSKVFPKAVIVIDLNNVKYVNDNYGYESGDKLIKGAASILVSTQLENTEIIRTDGNEFLIYSVGYSEQQIATYSKKLAKEFKELPYGFGAALGYSMILDEIKTIDDAINEAILNMRQDKEDNR